MPRPPPPDRPKAGEQAPAPRPGLPAALRPAAAVLEHTPLAVALLTPQGDFLWANSRFEKLLGFDLAALRQKSYLDLTHPRDIAKSRRYLMGQVKAYNPDKTLEKRCLDAQGKVRHVLVSTSVLPGPGGQPAAFLAQLVDLTAIKESQKALAEREQMLDQLFHTMPFIVYVYDLNQQKIVFTNQTVEPLLGYNRAELAAMGSDFPPGLLHPADRTVVKDYLRLLPGLKDGQTWQVQYRLKHKNGRWVWLKSQDGVFVRGAKGRLSQTVGLAQDITREKEALLALAEHDRKLATLMAHLPGMAFRRVAGRGGRMSFVSEGCVELSGYTPKQLTATRGGVKWRDLIHPDDQKIFLDAVTRAVAQNRPWRVEYRFKTSQGQWKWAWEQGEAVLAPGGEVQSLEGFITDLTEKKWVEEALRVSEARHRSITEHTTDLTLVLDHQHHLVYLNPAVTQATRLTLDETLTQPLLTFIHPQDRDAVTAVLAQAGQTPGQAHLLPHFRLQKKDGGWVNLEGSFSGIAGEPVVGATAINARDISKRLSAEEALRKSEERFALAIAGANDGLWDWDLTTHQVFFSPRFQAMLGLAEEAATTTPMHWLARVHEEDRERVQEQLQTHLRGDRPHLEVEYRIRLEDGSWRWMLTRGLAVRDESGEPVRMAGSQTDIHERKRTERQLFFDAFHDPLTQLPNRALFMDRLGTALKRLKRRRGYLFAVLFMDLDRFKVINDSLGHMAGDELLIRLSRRLKDCLRAEDTLARLGGDEFVVLLDEIEDVKGAIMVAERLQDSLAEPLEIGGQEVFTTVSIGIALSSPDYARAEDLLRDADIALYRAKKEGKARHALFDKTMHESALAQLKMETALRRGLAREEFRVYFQPIVRLQTGAIAGFEALVRWEQPGTGLTLPGQFIPLTEETGLVSALGLWVMKEALTQLRSWRVTHQKAQPLFLSVNLSGRQLLQPDLAGTVRELLTHTGVPADRLRLEITESAVLGGFAEVTQNLTALKEMGVRLDMDDFGTGYSSLSYLHQLPIDTIKIDRSFVSRMDQPGQAREFVRTIIQLARSIHLEVVAEGVETPTQRNLLLEMGCDYAQGFWFSEPVPATQAGDLLRRDLPWQEKRTTG